MFKAFPVAQCDQLYSDPPQIGKQMYRKFGRQLLRSSARYEGSITRNSRCGFVGTELTC